MYKYFALTLTLFASLIVMGCSDEFVPPIGPASQTDTVIVIPPALDTLTCLVETSIAVGDSKSKSSETIEFCFEGEANLWFLFKFDAWKNYNHVITIGYGGGSERQFQLDDLYPDRPTTILFDMGPAHVEKIMKITVTIPDLDNASAQRVSRAPSCDGWNRLLEIHASMEVPKTNAAFDKVIRLYPESGN